MPIDMDRLRRRVVMLHNEAEHGRLTTQRFNDAALAASYGLFRERLGLPEAYAAPNYSKGPIAWPETKVVHEDLRPFMREATVSVPVSGSVDMLSVASSRFFTASAVFQLIYVKSGGAKPPCKCTPHSSSPTYDIYSRELDLVRPHHESYRMGSFIRPARENPFYTVRGSDDGAWIVQVYPASSMNLLVRYLVRPKVAAWVAVPSSTLDVIETYDDGASTDMEWDITLFDTIADRVCMALARNTGTAGKYQAAASEVASGR